MGESRSQRHAMVSHLSPAFARMGWYLLRFCFAAGATACAHPASPNSPNSAARVAAGEGSFEGRDLCDVQGNRIEQPWGARVEIPALVRFVNFNPGLRGGAIEGFGPGPPLDLPPSCLCQPLPVAVGASRAPIARCYEAARKPAAGELREGCRSKVRIVLLLRTRNGVVLARTPEQVAGALAPIDTPAEAAALVYALEDMAIGPTRVDLEVLARTYKWSSPPRDTTWLSAEAGSGFIITAPIIPRCECYHPLLAREFEVARDGRVWASSDGIVVNAAGRSVCVD